MDTKEFNPRDEQQTLRFTVSYDENHPIAVDDFTKALDGLNQLYKSYVLLQLNSERFNHYEESIDLEKIGNFYIQDIKSCCISAILLDPKTWEIIGHAADIVGFISFIDIIYTKIKNWRSKSNDSDKEKENKPEDSTSTTIKNLGPAENLIQIVNSPGATIKIEAQGTSNRDSKTQLEIGHEEKREIDHGLQRIHHNLQFPHRYSEYNIISLRQEWVQIERNNYDGQYYVVIFSNPIIKTTKASVEIRNEELIELIEWKDNNNILNQYAFLVDIDIYANYRYGNTKYVIYSCYDHMPIEFFLD